MSKRRRGGRPPAGSSSPAEPGTQAATESGEPTPGSDTEFERRSGSSSAADRTPGSTPVPTSGTTPGGSGSGTGSAPGKRAPRIGRRTIPPGDGDAGSGGGATPPATRPAPRSLREAGARPKPPAARPSRPTTRPSGDRAGERDGGARRGGGLFGAFRAPSVYPKLGETYSAGGRAVLASPVLVVGSMLLVLALWFALLAVGLGHVPQFFQNLLAIPPLSSFFDLNVAFNALGLTLAAALLALALTAVRALIWAVITSLVVERLDSGRITASGVRRGVRFFPSFLGIFVVEVGLIYFSQLLRVVLGTSFGGLAFFAALVGGVHFLAFAPIIVIRNGISARAALGQSTRAARLPGSRHVGMVLLYFMGAFLLPSFVPMSSAFTVNPSLAVWTLVLAGTMFHLVSLGGLAYRYGVIEEDVPAAPPRRARTRTPLFGRR